MDFMDFSKWDRPESLAQESKEIINLSIGLQEKSCQKSDVHLTESNGKPWRNRERNIRNSCNSQRNW